MTIIFFPQQHMSLSHPIQMSSSISIYFFIVPSYGIILNCLSQNVCVRDPQLPYAYTIQLQRAAAPACDYDQKLLQYIWEHQDNSSIINKSVTSMYFVRWANLGTTSLN